MYSTFFKDHIGFINKSSDRLAIRTTSARRPAFELWIMGRCWEDFAPLLLFCQCMRPTHTRHCRYLLHFFLITDNFCVSWEIDNLKANQKVLIWFCSNIYISESYVFFRRVQEWKEHYSIKQGKKVQFIIINKNNFKKTLKNQSFTVSVRTVFYILCMI